jgi:hypothetical protein
MWILALALAQEPDPFIERAEAAAAFLAAAGPQEQQRWADVLAAYARDPNPKVSTPAVDALARYVRGAAAVRLAAAGPQEQQRWADVLAAYARDPNPKLSTPAVDALARYVRASLGKKEAPALRTALDRVHTGHPELVLEVIQSGLPGWQRAGALEYLGADAFPFLRRALADPELAARAAIRIGQVGRGDPELLLALISEGEVDRDPETLAYIAWTLRVFTGDASRSTIESWIPRLRGWHRTEALWFSRKISAWDVLDRLVERELVAKPDPLLLERHAGFNGEHPGPSSREFVMGAFNASGRLFRLSAHGLYEPLKYSTLLRGFAESSHGLLKPEEVEEVAGVLTFKHRRRAYTVAPRKLGDWYDLPPLLKAVNQALEDVDVPERFVGLDHGAQIAAFVLTVPDRFLEAAREFRIPLEPDADAARKRSLSGR